MPSRSNRCCRSRWSIPRRDRRPACGGSPRPGSPRPSATPSSPWTSTPRRASPSSSPPTWRMHQTADSPSSLRWAKSRTSTTSRCPPSPGRSRARTPTEPCASTRPWTTPTCSSPRSSPSPKIPTGPSRPSPGSEPTRWSSAGRTTGRSRCGNSAPGIWRVPTASRRSRSPANATTSAAWRTPTRGSFCSRTSRSRASTRFTWRRARRVSTTSLNFP